MPLFIGQMEQEGSDEVTKAHCNELCTKIGDSSEESNFIFEPVDTGMGYLVGAPEGYFVHPLYKALAAYGVRRRSLGMSNESVYDLPNGAYIVDDGENIVTLFWNSDTGEEKSVVVSRVKRHK